MVKSIRFWLKSEVVTGTVIGAVAGTALAYVAANESKDFFLPYLLPVGRHAIRPGPPHRKQEADRRAGGRREYSFAYFVWFVVKKN